MRLFGGFTTGRSCAEVRAIVAMGGLGPELQFPRCPNDH